MKISSAVDQPEPCGRKDASPVLNSVALLVQIPNLIRFLCLFGIPWCIQLVLVLKEERINMYWKDIIDKYFEKGENCPYCGNCSRQKEGKCTGCGEVYFVPQGYSLRVKLPTIELLNTLLCDLQNVVVYIQSTYDLELEEVFTIFEDFFGWDKFSFPEEELGIWDKKQNILLTFRKDFERLIQPPFHFGIFLHRDKTFTIFAPGHPDFIYLNIVTDKAIPFFYESKPTCFYNPSSEEFFVYEDSNTIYQGKDINFLVNYKDVKTCQKYNITLYKENGNPAYISFTAFSESDIYHASEYYYLYFLPYWYLRSESKESVLYDYGNNVFSLKYGYRVGKNEFYSIRKIMEENYK